MNIWFVLFCLSVSAICKAVQDTVVFHQATMIFPKSWGTLNSWRNKWAIKEDGTVDFKKERFWLSSTVLVFLTDAWHFFGFVQRLALFGLIAWLWTGHFNCLFWAAVVGLFVCHAIVFHILYEFVFEGEPLIDR